MPLFCLNVLLLAGTPGPSPSQLFERCRQAYDAVKSFEEDVRASVGLSTGTAHISFQRPRQLRVTGNTMFGPKYELLVNGSSAWTQIAGTWARSQSADIGIARITGISANAGTRVPALLLHANAIPFPTFVSAKKERIGNRDTLRLKGNDPMNTNVWIDRKSYFLVKTTGSAMGRSITVDFAPPKVDKPIPKSRFVK